MSLVRKIRPYGFYKGKNLSVRKDIPKQKEKLQDRGLRVIRRRTPLLVCYAIKNIPKSNKKMQKKY